MNIVKLQMNGHFADQKNAISIIGYLAVCRFVSCMNDAQQVAVKRAMPHYVQGTVTFGLNCLVCAENYLTLFSRSVCNINLRYRKLLRFYLEVVSYLLTKYENDKDIAQNDATILGYVPPSKMTSQQYTDNLSPNLPGLPTTTTTLLVTTYMPKASPRPSGIAHSTNWQRTHETTSEILHSRRNRFRPFGNILRTLQLTVTGLPTRQSR